VARVSASRMLLATERMLTTFPIQSLEDAPSMVEFSRFPAALATAAEVYMNLETAVRAAKATEREAIFLEYTKQMERLDGAAKRRLSGLRVARVLAVAWPQSIPLVSLGIAISDSISASLLDFSWPGKLQVSSRRRVSACLQDHLGSYQLNKIEGLS
jgi:hypothetical protein